MNLHGQTVTYTVTKSTIQISELREWESDFVKGEEHEADRR